MKRLIIAMAALFSFAANASNVGVDNSNTMRGGVNLECTSSNGDVLEVNGYGFPQSIQILSRYYDLQFVKRVDGEKIYGYKYGFNDYTQFLIIQRKNGVTAMYSYNDSQKYLCEK